MRILFIPMAFYVQKGVLDILAEQKIWSNKNYLVILPYITSYRFLTNKEYIN